MIFDTCIKPQPSFEMRIFVWFSCFTMNRLEGTKSNLFSSQCYMKISSTFYFFEVSEHGSAIIIWLQFPSLLNVRLLIMTNKVFRCWRIICHKAKSVTRSIICILRGNIFRKISGPRKLSEIHTNPLIYQ